MNLRMLMKARRSWWKCGICTLCITSKETCYSNLEICFAHHYIICLWFSVYVLSRSLEMLLVWLWFGDIFVKVCYILVYCCSFSFELMLVWVDGIIMLIIIIVIITWPTYLSAVTWNSHHKGALILCPKKYDITSDNLLYTITVSQHYIRVNTLSLCRTLYLY